jgi:hypothetical protein
MKSTLRFVTLASPALVVAAAAFLTAAEMHVVQPGDLTVHEWGTFTSVAGEDGSAIEWDTLGCQNDLPSFVNNYGISKWRVTGTVRMETPVMYFYSSRELDAHVKVEFPQGLITEWYPGANTSRRGLTGAIEWQTVKVQPGTAPTLPIESGPSRYYAARETDAAPIMVGDQHEKFLFYRGVGRFPVPLSARVSGYGKILVENRGHDLVPNVILFENRGGRMGYRNVGAVQDAVALDSPSLDSSVSQLRHALETALVAQGLFPKEAQAMLETWRDSWFEEGSRLIYIVPSPAVDAILPLQIEPAPSGTARVFVGRIELVTPETESSVESAIAKSDWSAINRYSRFLDPILRRIYSGNLSKVSEAEKLFRNFQGAAACP